MTTDERARKMDKIRKCMRLANSSNSNEAAAALRQAQAMMRELGVEYADVGEQPTVGEVVITKEAYGGCRYLQWLIHLVTKTFGIEGIWEMGNGISRKRANVRYIGPANRVGLAVYAHRVIDRAVAKAWEEHGVEFRQKPGARAVFRISFIAAIADKVEKLAIDTAEERGIKNYKDAKYPALVSKSSKAVRGPSQAAVLGHIAGGQFDIHRPMGTEGNRIGADK